MTGLIQCAWLMTGRGMKVNKVYIYLYAYISNSSWLNWYNVYLLQAAAIKSQIESVNATLMPPHVLSVHMAQQRLLQHPQQHLQQHLQQHRMHPHVSPSAPSILPQPLEAPYPAAARTSAMSLSNAESAFAELPRNAFRYRAAASSTSSLPTATTPLIDPTGGGDVFAESLPRVCMLMADVQVCMTYSYVCHDPFICVTWLIHMCAMTHSYAWHVKWQVHGYDINHLFVSHTLSIYVTWLIHVCDMTHDSWLIWAIAADVHANNWCARV